MVDVSHCVGLAAQGRESPAFRIRVALPARQLTAAGIHMELLPLFDARQSRAFSAGGVGTKAALALSAHRRLSRRIDELSGQVATALVQRQVDLLPFLSLERRATAGRRLVLDIDDAIWHDGRASGGHPLGILKATSRKLGWLAERAAVVIAGNELIAERLARHADDVRVIPSLVDVPEIPQREHSNKETVVLGWIGSPTTGPFLEAMRPALEQTARELSPRPVELLVVGADIGSVPGVRVRKLKWSQDAEMEALGLMDVGLMPLDDTPFTRGKCAYKALQYMAAGVPVVADDVGISSQVIGDRAGGLVVRTPGEWVEALRTLAHDVVLRTRLGAEGRRRVADGFSYERWLPEIAAVLRGA